MSELDWRALWNAVIPSASDGWLMALYGVAVGFFVIPSIIRWIEQDREYDRFYDTLGSESLRKARTQLFKNVSRAYVSWKSVSDDYPESLQELIENAEFPGWVPVINGDFSETAREEYEGIPSDLWDFCHSLYGEVDKYIRRRDYPTLLSHNEIDELHDARQTLSYFWDNVAVLLIRRRKLRYRNIKPHLEAESTLIKLLIHLAIENSVAIGEKGAGPKYLLYLGAILFKKKSWGVKEWIWNPLLSASENLRT